MNEGLPNAEHTPPPQEAPPSDEQVRHLPVEQAPSEPGEHIEVRLGETDQTQPAETEPTQEQSTPVEQPEAEQQVQPVAEAESTGDLPALTPFEKGISQPTSTEQVKPSTSEISHEDMSVKMAEAKDLFERGQQLLAQGHVENDTSASRLSFSEQVGWHTIRLVHQGEEASNEWILMFQDNFLKASKSLDTGDTHNEVTVTMDVVANTSRGELTNYGPDHQQTGPIVRLNDMHSRAIQETVLSQLQREVEMRELDAKKELDKKVADILGLELEHFSKV